MSDPTIEVVSDSSTSKKSRAGVRGWLLWLCISQSILFPLAFLLDLVTRQSASWSILLGVLAGAWSMFVGIRLWAVHRKAFGTARVYFTANIVIMSIGIVVGSVLAAAADATEGIIFVVLFALFLARFAVWSVYLSKSIRVRNTYPNAEDSESGGRFIAFVKKALRPLAFIIYAGVAIAQVVATIQGLTHTLGFFGIVLAVVFGPLPVVGTIMGVIGAVKVWGWPIWAAILLFVGSLPVTAVLGFFIKD